MTGLQARLLAAIVAEPGEWTADEHADDLGVDRNAALQAVYRLAEAGLVAPRAYRLHAGAQRLLAAGKSHADLVGTAYWRLDARATALEWVARLESGPFFRDDRDLSGSDKRVLAHLHHIGIVSPPGCLWPTEAGRAAFRAKAA